MPSVIHHSVSYILRTSMQVKQFIVFEKALVLVGCWSSVSIRRIIYKFLNVCPFD